mmetsp:Transcript_70151/g.198863  ORF Transcript_70151/g.198863 Transcript_70151/m.198863 type:complete len:304 (-) Transcript_70151:944-1855(-)
MSSTGCPECPSTATPSTVQSKGLLTDLKSLQSRTLLNRYGCNGIWGRLRFVGSERPGMTSTEIFAASRARKASASWRAALASALPVRASAVKVPPHTRSFCTAPSGRASLPPSSISAARSRAAASSSAPGPSVPKPRPETRARKEPGVADAARVFGSEGCSPILAKQRAEIRKLPSGVGEPRTAATMPVARRAICSGEATSRRRMEESSSHKVSSSELSLLATSASVSSPRLPMSLRSLYWSMTLGLPFNSLNRTPMSTASRPSPHLLKPPTSDMNTSGSTMPPQKDRASWSAAFRSCPRRAA